MTVNWLEEARKIKWAATFPIRIEWSEAAQKWEKRPLTKNGHKDAQCPPDPAQSWHRANGFGIAADDTWLALDVDAYKDDTAETIKAWFHKHGLDARTRAHKTVSGGWHFFYCIPAKWAGKLGNRANIVHGLDSRARGGWTAFGKGYELARAKPPAMLTESACAALAPKDGVTLGSGMVVVKDTDYLPPVPDHQEKILLRLRDQVIPNNHNIQRVWRGVPKDRSTVEIDRSTLDMSLAWYLTAYRFSQSEIIWVLLEVFDYGQAQGKYSKEPSRALRAAKRCAARAKVLFEEGRTASKTNQVSPEQNEDVMAAIAAQQGEKR